MSETLKVCPFCGDEPEHTRDGNYHVIRCPDCGAEHADEIKHKATARWNARVDASERHADGEYIGHLQARVEGLEAAARFLIARIDEWEADGLNDDNARDWMGHVQPSLERLRALTPPEQDKGS